MGTTFPKSPTFPRLCKADACVLGPVSTVSLKKTGLYSLLCEAELQFGAPSNDSPGSRSKSLGGKSGLPKRVRGKACGRCGHCTFTRFSESTSGPSTSLSPPGLREPSADDSLRLGKFSENPESPGTARAVVMPASLGLVYFPNHLEELRVVVP